MIKPIYLDYNGTTPHDPEVIEAMRPFLETEFGNPSSAHWYGIKPKQAVETARSQVAGIRLNGHIQHRLPNTLSISFKGLEANRILEEIGLEVAASAGAACHSDSVEISHVLKAMGIPLEWAKGTIRFSVGRMTTQAEIDQTIRVVADAVKKFVASPQLE